MHSFPLTVGIFGADASINLIVNDADIFKPNPVLNYNVDLCDVSSAMMDLFAQLKVLIVAAVRAPFGDIPIMFDIDR